MYITECCRIGKTFIAKQNVDALIAYNGAATPSPIQQHGYGISTGSRHGFLQSSRQYLGPVRVPLG